MKEQDENNLNIQSNIMWVTGNLAILVIGSRFYFYRDIKPPGESARSPTLVRDLNLDAKNCI